MCIEYSQNDFFKEKVRSDIEEAMNKKPNPVIKQFFLKKFDLNDSSPIIDNLYYRQETENDIEIFIDVLYQGNIKMSFEFLFHYVPLSVKLDLEILELYGKIGMLFKPSKMGLSKFYFQETPFFRANAEVSLGEYSFKFHAPIDNFFIYYINKFLFDAICYPEFVPMDLPLTEIPSETKAEAHKYRSTSFDQSQEKHKSD